MCNLDQELVNYIACGPNPAHCLFLCKVLLEHHHVYSLFMAVLVLQQNWIVRRATIWDVKPKYSLSSWNILNCELWHMNCLEH